MSAKTTLSAAAMAIEAATGTRFLVKPAAIIAIAHKPTKSHIAVVKTQPRTFAARYGFRPPRPPVVNSGQPQAHYIPLAWGDASRIYQTWARFLHF
jgi:hypothetical protein